MNRIICANCGRNHDLGYFEYKAKNGGSVGIIYLCDVCRMLLKKVDLNMVVDDEKIQAIKKNMKLSEEKKNDKKGIDKKESGK